MEDFKISRLEKELIGGFDSSKYEKMTDEEIRSCLEECLSIMGDIKSINNGEADKKAIEFERLVYFLNSIKRLPEEFEEYL